MVYLPHWPIPSTFGGAKIDYETVFERMEIVLERLGNPEYQLPAVIHITGTNGKGSVAALLTQIFKCANYKTHLYTSPHLRDCNERIVLDGEKISDSKLFEVMEEARIASNGVSLTFMEAFTIGAILAFAKSKADILVMECGMGGRIDATNIIPRKIASIITPISFDHTEYLGNSIERIALEKAMIMRQEALLIVASQPQAAKNIIKILADDQGIKSYFYDHDFSVIANEENGEFDLDFLGQKLINLPKPALPGSHQYINFATAISAIMAINQSFPQFFVEEKFIHKGIINVKWPSRLEKIDNGLCKLLKNDDEIWIDGAHNVAGAFAIARWLLEEKSDYQIYVIVGFSRGKCKKEFLSKFANIAKIIAIRVEGEPYPEEVERIVEIGSVNNIEISSAASLLDAVFSIGKEKSDLKKCVLICGSLHLARDVDKYGL